MQARSFSDGFRGYNMKRELTAKEEQDILDRDPKYQALMADKERQWAELDALLEHDETTLIQALTKAGWPSSVQQIGMKRSICDLVNSAEPYPHLLETLADHLTRPYHNITREGITRALIVPEARATRVPRIMMDELKRQTDPSQGLNSYRWTLIYALETIGDRSMLEEVRQLLQDERYSSVQIELKCLERILSRRRGRPRQRRAKGKP